MAKKLNKKYLSAIIIICVIFLSTLLTVIACDPDMFGFPHRDIPFYNEILENDGIEYYDDDNNLVASYYCLIDSLGFVASYTNENDFINYEYNVDTPHGCNHVYNRQGNKITDWLVYEYPPIYPNEYGGVTLHSIWAASYVGMDYFFSCSAH